MKKYFRLTPFEIILLAFFGICSFVAILLLLSGTIFYAMPDFNESLIPPVFDANYGTASSSSSSLPPETTPSPTPMTTQDVPSSPPLTNTSSSSAEGIVTAPTPLPTLAPTQSERIFLLYPASQALMTHTRVDEGKGYSLKLKFEVDPRNTACKLKLKMGDELILEKELDGSPTGIYEVSVLIKKPALYKWEVTTAHASSGERLFTIRK